MMSQTGNNELRYSIILGVELVLPLEKETTGVCRQ